MQEETGKKWKADEPAKAGQISAIVYSTPTCPYCTMMKGYLESRKIKFQEIDVSKDAEKAQEMIRKTDQTGVPVVEINGIMVIGFDRAAIDDAIAGRKRISAMDVRNNLAFDLFDL